MTNSRLVLIVEDDLYIRKFLCLALRDAGFEVIETGTAEGALQALQQDLPPDAVIADLTLADGTAAPVLEWFSRRDGLKRPALMIISALDRDDAIRRFGLPREPYLRKPFDPREAVQLLESLLLQEGKGGGSSQSTLRA